MRIEAELKLAILKKDQAASVTAWARPQPMILAAHKTLPACACWTCVLGLCVLAKRYGLSTAPAEQGVYLPLELLGT
jgi:hypothetical protein